MEAKALKLLIVNVTFLLGCMAAALSYFAFPASSQMSVLGTKCLEEKPTRHQDEWYLARGRHRCRSVEFLYQPNKTEDNIIYTFQIPIPRNGIMIDFSHWQKYLKATIAFEYILDKHIKLSNLANLNIVPDVDLRLYGQMKEEEEEDKWIPLTSEVISSQTKWACSSSEQSGWVASISCEPPQPLFEVQVLRYDYYLINVRILRSNTSGGFDPVHINFEKPDDLWIGLEIQNTAFTKLWMSLETIFFIILVGFMVSFFKMVFQLPRPPRPVEYSFLFLGTAYTLICFPLELLTLKYECPWMFLYQDLRQILLQFLLFSQWTTLVRECKQVGFSLCKMTALLGAAVIFCSYEIYQHGGHSFNTVIVLYMTDCEVFLSHMACILRELVAVTFVVYLCIEIFTGRTQLSMCKTQHLQRVIMYGTLAFAGLTAVVTLFEQRIVPESVNDNIRNKILLNPVLTGLGGIWSIVTCVSLIGHSTSKEYLECAKLKEKEQLSTDHHSQEKC